MYVEEIGENKLVELLTETIRNSGVNVCSPDTKIVVPPGDDAASWKSPAETLVLTTDALVESVHFDLKKTDWNDLGWKIIAVNLSDIAAMGCNPTYTVVSLGLRGNLPVSGIIEMYEGMLDASRIYGCALVGGDIVNSPNMFVSVAMLGIAQSGYLPLKRSTAKVGDMIGITGNLGCSAGGMQAMNNDSVIGQEILTHLTKAHNRPIPRIKQGAILTQNDCSAAMDISDGLIKDLKTMCRASNVGATIALESVPVDRYLIDAYPETYLSLALSGGEDYELLFTAPPEAMSKIVSLVDIKTSVIGKVVKSPVTVTVTDKSGNTLPFNYSGWTHFGNNQP